MRSQRPGAIPDNDNFSGIPLTVSKLPSGLNLSWAAPGGTCITADYGIYRGSLPWIGYNHAFLICSTGGLTSHTINSDTGSYYYIIVSQNNDKEGLYGLDLSNNPIPAANTPCLAQQIGTCN